MLVIWAIGNNEHPDHDHLKPCLGQNSNVCVAEGCFNEACADLALKAES